MRLRCAVLVLGVVLTGLIAPMAATAAPTVPTDTTAAYVVVDRSTGRTVASSAPHLQFRSASLVKLLIAIDYLQGKTTVPANDAKMLESMLRSSDDDAASSFWVRGGYEAVVQRMVRLIGLVDTVPPTDRRYWGYTGVSAADVATIYSYLLDRATPSIRDRILGYLERSTQCGADGFDQSFGIPRAVSGTRAVKQGWSGYGTAPARPCVEGRDDTPPDAASQQAAEEAPQVLADNRATALAAPTLDLSRRALHTSGLVDSRRRVMVVLTLSPKTKSYEDQSATVTSITRTLHDEATAGTTTTTTPPPTTTPPTTTIPPVLDPIDVYAAQNSASLGPATSGTYTVPGGTARDYRDGTVYYSRATGAKTVRGTILARYRAVGGPGSVLGFPSSEERDTADRGGRISDFAGASGSALLWRRGDSTARAVTASTYAKYKALGEARSLLAYPVTDTAATPDGRGRFTHFSGSGGSIYYNPARATPYAVYGSIRARWSSLGWERSSLGYPVSDEYAVAGGRRSDFDRGSITWNAATGATSVVTR